LYTKIAGAKPVKTPKPRWKFPSGAEVTFAQLEYDKDVFSFQGAEICLIEFDEATHFTEAQFWYLLSRNRSTCGVRPYFRMSCNPDPDSWLAKMLEWYINQDTGYAIPERSGVIRWFIRIEGVLHWADTKEELIERFELRTPEQLMQPKSFSFVVSSLFDNQVLMNMDPGYYANLKALPLVEQERLLFGNWKIKPASGLYFKRSQVEMIDALPNDVKQWVRAWDLAATEKEDADATASVLLGKRKNGNYVVASVTNGRMNAADVRNYVLNTAKSDKASYKRVKIRLSQDPGQAGKEQAESYVKMLAGFSVVTKRESGDKLTRAEPVSAQWIHGNVEVLIAPWNDMFFNQLEQFGDETCLHDDMVDALSNAFNELESAKTAYAPPKEEKLTKESYWLRG
ncbi:MAG: phage terminase large subunit, partial [Peptococcaceae bacterium]|nr:phage terminase large subunit [Peptococcaceae bacterium]